MELWTMALRTLLMYIVILIAMRIMGKREIGKLSVFDLVISILIAELAVFSIDEPEAPLMESVTPIAAIVVMQLLLAWLTMKSRTARLIIDGKPSLIIEKGQLNREEMRKQRYNIDDLMMQLREKNIQNVADVEFAILEASGKLSVVPKVKMKDKERNYSDGIRYEGLPIPLVMDGKVNDENLAVINKTRFWLKNELQARHVTDVKDVFLCTFDHRGRIYIDLKRRPGKPR